MSGISGAGKAFVVRRLIQHIDKMLDPSPQKVTYAYNVWQKIFSEMEKEHDFVQFIEGVPSENDLENLSNNEPQCFILDDMMLECVNYLRIETLFTQGSHNRNLTVLFLNENVFLSGETCTKYKFKYTSHYFI